MPQYPEIRNVLDSLLSVCDGAASNDGAGFNKFDREFADIAHDKQDWSPKMAAGVRKMLKKYKKQLSGFGIDYEALPTIEIPSDSTVIRVEGMQAQISFPYSQETVEKVRRIPGRFFDGNRKLWLVDLTETGAREGLQAFAQAQSAVLPPLPEPVVQASEDFPAEAPVEFKSHPVRITIPDLNKSDHMEIRFPYSQDILEKVRQIPGRMWDGEKKTWVIDLSRPFVAEALDRFSEDTGAPLPESYLRAREAKIAADAKAKDEAMKGIVDSQAVDAEYEVEGLRGSLMPFQKAGVKYICERRRVINGDEMGLGKTIQAIACIQKLQAFPALIIVPKTLRSIPWFRELRKWLPKDRTVDFYSRSVLLKSADVQICTYEEATRFKSFILEQFDRGVGFKSLVCDEAHFLKNHKANRSQAAFEIAQAIYQHYPNDCLILPQTGTPVLNRPAEVIFPLQILSRLEDFGGLQKFRHRYVYGNNLEELQQIMRATCFIRREKTQVLKELPPKRHNLVVIPISQELRHQYLKLERSPLPGLTMADAIVRIGQLRKLAADIKMEGAVEWVRSFLHQGRKLILFTWHREAQQRLLQEFPDAARILGETSDEDRITEQDRFQEDPKCQLIICSLKVAGVGLTLTAASDVAFLEFGWTPGDMDQAVDRAHRIGQIDSVDAWYFCGRLGIDVKMMNLIRSKREIGDRMTKAAHMDKITEESSKQYLAKQILDAYARRMAREKVAA